MVRAEVHFVAALEQLSPSTAVSLAARADEQGFGGTVVSDRFQPWLPSQGNASFAWTVLGAIGQRTKGALTVSAVPGFRMHPASVAQAAATLASLYPGRHRLALSAGDAIDEHVVGQYWPEGPERAARMFEAADLIRKLFNSSAKHSDIRHSGDHFSLETTRLWTMPESPPPLQVWAGGPVTARRAGRTTDGMIVQAATTDRLAALRDAFLLGAKETGRSSGTLAVHAQISWAPTDEEAMEFALRDWPMTGLRFPRGDIRSPFDVAQLARAVTADDIRSRIPVTSNAEVLRAHVQSFFDLGFDAVHVHNVGRNQSEWIDFAGREILPKLVR
jgi:coenzyme F420-dependent glucose-6-phosphate dehydrogenase